MFKINSRLAFLLSLPTLIPFILFCLDVAGPKKEINSFVTNKAPQKGGYCIFFTKSSCTPSKENYAIYRALKIGDPVTLKVGSVIKSIYGFTYSDPPKPATTYDCYFISLICLIAALSLYISSQLLFSKTRHVAVLEGAIFKGFAIFLIFGYCITAYFVYLAYSDF